MSGAHNRSTARCDDRTNDRATRGAWPRRSRLTVLYCLRNRCDHVCASHRIARRPHCRADRGAGRPDCAGAPAPLAAGNSLSTRTAGNSWFRFTRGTKRFNCAAPAPNARLTRGRASSIHGFRAACCGIRCRVAFVGFCKTCTVNGRGTAAVDRVTSGAWARVCRVSLRWALQIAVCLPQRV